MSFWHANVINILKRIYGQISPSTSVNFPRSGDKSNTWLTALANHQLQITCHHLDNSIRSFNQQDLPSWNFRSELLIELSQHPYQLPLPQIGSSSIITIKRRYFKKEFPKWVKWDNSIKCCHRTWLACGKKNRVQKDPPPWQAYPLWQNYLKKNHLNI